MLTDYVQARQSMSQPQLHNTVTPEQATMLHPRAIRARREHRVHHQHQFDEHLRIPATIPHHYKMQGVFSHPLLRAANPNVFSFSARYPGLWALLRHCIACLLTFIWAILFLIFFLFERYPSVWWR